ncbi:MAG TPA: hypothetical protein VH251_09920 [Verrucomicrobiae bacterium]|jgi:hypothetical protein|nr:hypothetical protein [Verrucomicrobiae bacterium]
MIALHSECLLFQLKNGESVPCSADMIAVEIIGEANGLLEPETLRHAAASVFHYFKTELAREAVTIGEFSLALEKALHHLGYTIHAQEPAAPPTDNPGADLARMVSETDSSLELLFFPRLRDELRVRLRHSPRVVRFHGLRGCVKQLAGARRWSNRCERLQDQIVAYLRGCLTAETAQNECALVVE